MIFIALHLCGLNQVMLRGKNLSAVVLIKRLCRVITRRGLSDKTKLTSVGHMVGDL